MAKALGRDGGIWGCDNCECKVICHDDTN